MSPGPEPEAYDPIDLAVKPRLEGMQVLLRPVDPADVEVFIRILAEPEVRRLTGSVAYGEEDEPDDPAVLRDWYLSRNDTDDRLDLVIVDRVTGEGWTDALIMSMLATDPRPGLP